MIAPRRAPERPGGAVPAAEPAASLGVAEVPFHGTGPSLADCERRVPRRAHRAHGRDGGWKGMVDGRKAAVARPTEGYCLTIFPSVLVPLPTVTTHVAGDAVCFAVRWKPLALPPPPSNTPEDVVIVRLASPA